MNIEIIFFAIIGAIFVYSYLLYLLCLTVIWLLDLWLSRRD